MARGKRHQQFLAAVKKDGTYDRLVEAHGSEACWICDGKPKARRLSVDHDHKAMYVRGLLCFRCNRLLEDWVTPRWLRDAADYLEGSRKRYDDMIAGKRVA